jgi:hypothetical protein
MSNLKLEKTNQGFSMQKSFWQLIAIAVLSISCSHTVDFKTSHFAVPHVDEGNWGGSISTSVGAPSKITFVDDISTNPPTRNGIGINEDVDLGTLLLLDTIFIEAELGLGSSSFELFHEKGINGLRWQFWGFGSGKNQWVATVQGGAGSFSDQTTENTDTANTKITSMQKGMSIGYKTEKSIIYVSYIKNEHSGSTDVVNTNGSFGPYEDEGVHQHYGIGVSTYGPGILLGVEYNFIQLDWDGVSRKNQETVAARIGYSW